jgi:hypothetical protein
LVGDANFLKVLHVFYFFFRGMAVGIGIDSFTFESSLLALPQKTPKEPIPRLTIPGIGPALLLSRLFHSVYSSPAPLVILVTSSAIVSQALRSSPMFCSKAFAVLP